jgi:ketosteroid isomerase-like protein
MSQQDMELVARALREFGATHRPSQFAAPDVVWDMSGLDKWPDATEYRGPAGFEQFFAKWTEAYDEWDMTLDDLVDAGDHRVMAMVTQHARLRGSESWVDLNMAVLYTVGDGLIRRMQVFSSREAALEAAGVAGA